MNVIEGSIGGVPLILIEGDLDQSSKQVARDAVNEILQGAYAPESLLIDLTDCTFVDSGFSRRCSRFTRSGEEAA